MENNQFVVDLGDLKLTESERLKINKAIQHATLNELANIKLAAKKVFYFVEKGELIPTANFTKPPKPPKPPIINGFVMIPSKPIGIWLNYKKVDLDAINNLINK